METAKREINLTIITLPELLNILETGGDYAGVIKPWKKQQGLVVPPRNPEHFKTLLDILANNLSTKCARYLDNFYHYENVEYSYIRECLEESLSSIYPELSSQLGGSESDDEDDDDDDDDDEETSFDSAEQYQSQQREDDYYRLYLKFGHQSIPQLKKTLDKYNVSIPKLPKRADEPVLKNILIRALATESQNIPSQCDETQGDDQETPSTNFLFAFDINPDHKGFLPREKVYGDKPEKPKTEEAYGLLKKGLPKKVDKYLNRQYNYNSNPLSRIHGFIITETEGCDNIYHLDPIPKIIKLSVICTSPITNRVPPEVPLTVGNLLIGAFLITSRHMGYDYAILEVANDCAGNNSDDDGEDDPDDDEDDEDDEINSYGNKNYYLGKQSQANLFCNYERYGFREDPKLHIDYNCFTDDPFPSMKIALQKYSLDCLAKVSFVSSRPSTWSSMPSKFCQQHGFIPSNIIIPDEC